MTDLHAELEAAVEELVTAVEGLAMDTHDRDNRAGVHVHDHEPSPTGVVVTETFMHVSVCPHPHVEGLAHE